MGSAADFPRVESGRNRPAEHPFARRHAKARRRSNCPSFTSSTCSPTRPAPGCTSATRKVTPPRTFWPLSARAGLQCAASDGLGRLRPARRAIRHQDRPASAQDHRGEHRHVQAPDQIARLQLRLEPRNRHDRPAVFQMDAVDFPQALQFLVQSGRPTRPSRSRHSPTRPNFK